MIQSNVCSCMVALFAGQGVTYRSLLPQLWMARPAINHLWSPPPTRKFPAIRSIFAFAGWCIKHSENPANHGSFRLLTEAPVLFEAWTCQIFFQKISSNRHVTAEEEQDCDPGVRRSLGLENSKSFIRFGPQGRHITCSGGQVEIRQMEADFLTRKFADGGKWTVNSMWQSCILSIAGHSSHSSSIAWIRGKVDWYCGNYQTISGSSAESSGKFTGCWALQEDVHFGSHFPQQEVWTILDWGQAAMLAGFAFNFITAPMPKAVFQPDGQKTPPSCNVNSPKPSGSREWAHWNGVLLLCLCCYGSFVHKFGTRECGVGVDLLRKPTKMTLMVLRIKWGNEVEYWPQVHKVFSLLEDAHTSIYFAWLLCKTRWSTIGRTTIPFLFDISLEVL